MATVSLIIPTYNRKEYVQRCLESVYRQNRLPDEIIVVDDGSTDGTAVALVDHNITLLEQKNSGAGAARNLGAKVATGDYVTFLDSDDLWFPWSLECMMGLVERHNAGFLFASFMDFVEEEPTASYSEPNVEIFDDFLASSRRTLYAGAGMLLVEREAFLEVQGFATDGLNGEDHDLALRLGVLPRFLAIHSPVVVAHRIHSTNAMANISASIDGLERLINNERSGYYPGGRRRRASRQKIIAARSRPVVIAAAKGGIILSALKLYHSTMQFNVTAKRFRYLAVAPLLICINFVRQLLEEARH